MKIFKLFLLLLVISAFLLLAPRAHAQRSVADQASLCQRIDSVSANMISSMQAKRQKTSTTAVDEAIKSQLSPTNLTKLRNEADKIRQKHFEVIIIKLNNPAQRTAVENYRDSLDEAINQRRSAIDAAQNDFISQLIELQDQHQQSISESEDGMIDSVRQAFNSAKSNCEAGEDSQTVRGRLVLSLNTAKSQLASKKQVQAQDIVKFRQLVAQRNITIIKAVDTFKKSELQAKQQLLKEIGQTQK